MFFKKKKLYSYLVFAILLVFISNAYIDPGTGGMILGSIWSSILGFFSLVLGFFGIYFFKPIKRFFKNVFKKKQKKK